MDLQKLFLLQRELDHHIETEHNLQGVSLINKKILALVVELGELANETRCFKFWSNKSAAPKNVILEEYVDCLHFILSIGITSGFTNISPNFNVCVSDDIDITEILLDLNMTINNFMSDQSMETYILIFDKFFLLGAGLNFSLDEIELSYLNKNEINHKRQDEGY